ncbi:MAG: URC4/urg3 family protein [Proteobacteria bacterium]|nr:URC4/urg3 family protein [Pseudomonadota bacterium]
MAATKDSAGVSAAVRYLRSPAAIRARSSLIFQAALRGALAHFEFEPSQMATVVEYVARVMAESYPNGDIPYHSRWRHFEVDGVDRWGRLERTLVGIPPAEKLRIRFDLAITSVLLDAGAGAVWSFREAATGQVHARSEGLAVASFEMFTRGLFAELPRDGFRADAAGLRRLTVGRLAEGFQVSESNSLAGLEGRASLMRRLGDAIAASPAIFGRDRPRVGNLADYLLAQAHGRRLKATAILGAVLEGLAPIWPARVMIDGVNLGDVGRHPVARDDNPGEGLVPFHKLSQWLTYSLVEPLQAAGCIVTDLDELTGLPEYRNGGLFIDLGVLLPKHGDILRDRLPADAEPVVEWRALTVSLIDRLAEALRKHLKRDGESLPLARILQGGTWTAGRKIALERRGDGRPPIAIDSDATIF